MLSLLLVVQQDTDRGPGSPSSPLRLSLVILVVVLQEWADRLKVSMVRIDGRQLGGPVLLLEQDLADREDLGLRA